MSDTGPQVQPPDSGPLSVPEPAIRQLLLDLHDGPMQLIYAAQLQLELLQASLGGKGEAGHRAARLQDLLERASLELRRVIDRQRAPTESPDLLSLLREVGAQHQFATQTNVRIVAREHLPDPGPEAKHAFYRILQESLSNAFRHGRAEQVAVSLGLSEEDGSKKLWMSVQDDGIGFDPSDLPADRESGLSGMTERMRTAGGDLEVKSTPGSGTTVHAALEVN
jgi:two-component system sensor histidine kinase UhpB